jgi:hypothetical protein
LGAAVAFAPMNLSSYEIKSIAPKALKSHSVETLTNIYIFAMLSIYSEKICLEKKMDVKLTLKLDKDIIEQAKRYAQRKNANLSNMVENYFKSLVDEEKKTRVEYSPLVKELSGIISLESEVNPTDGYTDYLIEKYR